MAEPTNPTSEPDDASSGGSIDQSAIDALFGGASEDTPAAPEGEPEAPAKSAEDTAAPADEDAISQADIDTLLQAAGESADGGASDQESEQSDASAESSSAESAQPTAPDDRVDTLGRPFDEAAAAMQAALDEEKATAAASAPAPAPVPSLQTEPFELPDFDGGGGDAIDQNRLSMLSDVHLRVKIELGRTRMLVEDVLKLGEGSVVELDKLAGDPVDVWVNERLIARGEVLILNDNFCVRISEVFSHDPHRISA